MTSQKKMNEQQEEMEEKHRNCFASLHNTSETNKRKQMHLTKKKK